VPDAGCPDAQGRAGAGGRGHVVNQTEYFRTGTDMVNLVLSPRSP
jgi:hypothetical protein